MVAGDDGGVSTTPTQDSDQNSDQNDAFDLRLLWLLLIPGILIGAIVVHVIAGHGDLKPSAATSNLSVSVPAQVGRCAIPTAQQLSQFPTAVRAEVTDVGDEAVDLRVQNVLAGPQIGLVTVRLPASDLAGLIQELTEQMHQAAADLHFELAARLRDELSDLKRDLRQMEKAGHLG